MEADDVLTDEVLASDPMFAMKPVTVTGRRVGKFLTDDEANFNRLVYHSSTDEYEDTRTGRRLTRQQATTMSTTELAAWLREGDYKGWQRTEKVEDRSDCIRYLAGVGRKLNHA